MKVLSRPAVLAIALWIGGGTVVQAQEWVSHVKTRPLDFEGRDILLEGEVVEVQAVSPRSSRGMYRLVDGSDPTGVLVRTNDLPMTGGPFRIRARIAPEFLYQGNLLLEEGDRSAAGLPLFSLALAIVGAGLVGLLVTGVLYHRIRMAERHLRLGRPMWLIPVDDHVSTGSPSESGPPAEFDYRLHYIEAERSAEFEGRRRKLLLTLVASTAVTVVGVGGTVALRVADASRPSFVLLVPEVGTTEEPTIEPEVDQRETREDDPLRVQVLVPPPPSPPRRRVDTVPRATPGAVASVQQPIEALRLPVESVLAPPVAGPVVVPPPPPTPAEEVVREPPRPDPGVLLAAARAELEAGARRLVQAVNGRSVDEVEALVQAGGDARRRDRFLQFVREFGPVASLAASDAPALSDAGAEGAFTIGFRWRAEFGVQRQGSARFLGTLRRVGSTWVFEGARLFESFP